MLAIVMATAGVLIDVVAQAGRRGQLMESRRPGSVRGQLLRASAAIGFRGAVTSVETPSFVMAASVVLVLGLALQTLLLLGYLMALDRATMLAIVGAWRVLAVRRIHGRGVFAVLVSRLALTSAARVRTLALDRSGVRAVRLFAVPPVAALIGVPIVAAVVVLING